MREPFRIFQKYIFFIVLKLFEIVSGVDLVRKGVQGEVL